MALALLAMTALLAAAPVDAPRSPTNDEINAAEMGNPESAGYMNRPALQVTGNVNTAWEASEVANPDAVQSSARESVAVTRQQERNVAW